METVELAKRLQQEFNEEAAEKERRASFQCPLCFDTAAYSQSVELDCLHRFCSACFSNMLELKIREKRVQAEELLCPMPRCRCEVTVPQVEGITKGTALWDRFLESRAELWRPVDPDEERYCTCPKSGCGARFLVSASSREVPCPSCHVTLCAACCQLPHPGKSCEEYQRWKQENDAGELALEALRKAQGWQRCPKCSATCARAQGCNFMTCHSAQCRGKVKFCYICGDLLNEVQHVTHFPFGVFADGCRNVRPKDEELCKKSVFDIVGNDLRTWAGQLMEPQ